MVVYKDKTYIVDMEYPDTDWLGNADYIVSDNSDLAKKITMLYPNYEFVIDKNGKLIDVKQTAISESELTDYKNSRITHSKDMLSEWLAIHPLLYKDGEYYSVTEEKQSLLNSNLANYERAVENGIEYLLKWNSTGNESVEWKYSDLLKLSLAISKYVSPKVLMQQSYETQIKNANTIEEIDNIVINYD